MRLQLGEETRVYLVDQSCRKCKKIRLYARQCQFQCQTQNIQDKTSTIGIEKIDTRIPIFQKPLINWNPRIQSVKRGLSSLLVIIGYHSIGYHFAPFYSYYKSNPLNWNVFVTDVCQLRSRWTTLAKIVFTWESFMKIPKCSSGHVICTFDNPAETNAPEGLNLITFQKNCFPQNVPVDT